MPTFLDHRPHGSVLVVGDIMLDRYWEGPTRRISPEAPVPVVRVAKESERIGGAGNVAANVAALGANAELIGGTGVDAAGERLLELCLNYGISTRFLSDEAAETIIKLRVMSQHQQLLRLDFEPEATTFDLAALGAIYLERLEHADVVVLSDYGKGLLRDSQPLIRAAREAGKPVIVDPKTSDYSRYAGATLVTPNLAEFESCVGTLVDEQALVRKARALCAQFDIDNLLITRGERGMVLVQGQRTPLVLGADARDVFDVTGAGDTVCAALAAALASGQSLQDAVRLANVAAGIAVGKSGTATVSFEEIQASPGGAPASATTSLSIEELMPAIAAARARGERIIMTNGCFDILHAGHVAYLQQAKALGARLLVAVNSDASVTRLKGAARPLNRLEDRMAVLAGLGSVDWVVAFEDDTPASLVEHVGPDVLVKGGDYSVENIAGAEHVLRSGGEVLTLPLVDGLSTSRVVEQLSGMSRGDN